MCKFHYIGEKPIDSNHAGNKARVDVDRVFDSRNYTAFINLQAIEFKYFSQKIAYVLNLKGWKDILLLKTCKGKNIFLQYPAYYNSLLNQAVYSLLESNRNILVVHDVDSLRAYGKDIIEKEISKFNKCKSIIVHNLFMQKELDRLGCKVPMICLGLFDYLLPSIPKNNFEFGKTIVFAGNLGKSEFIKSKDFKDLKVGFNLYGPNYDEQVINHKNVEYKGSFKPDEIPYRLKGSFGLIWDGDSLDTCAGSVGEYMKYNNPHKLSLYIAAGLPVIVWKQAAVANFVEKHDIGLTVSSLKEISDKIDKLTKEEYEVFLLNIRDLQIKVCGGYFTNKALDEAEKYLI